MASIDYQAVKDAIYSWVALVAGQYLLLDASGNPYVFWEEESHDFMLAPYAKLSLTDGGRQGKDAVSYNYDNINKTLSPVIRGNRQILIGIEVRSRETTSPRNAIEDLRTSLEHPIHMQRLQDDGALAFISIENCQTGIGIHYEDRSEAIAILEVRFGIHAELVDATETVESVERAGLTNQVKNTDGTLVDPSASEELVGEGAPP